MKKAKMPRQAKHFVVHQCQCDPACKTIIIGFCEEHGEIPWGVCAVTPEQQPEFIAGFLLLMATKGEA